jgi:hypothetical protein
MTGREHRAFLFRAGVNWRQSAEDAVAIFVIAQWDRPTGSRRGRGVMSYAATPPAGGPIDILLAVRTAYSTVFENLRLACDLAWLPFALLVGAEMVALLLGGVGMFGMMLAALVRGLGFVVFGTIFIVRWHRFVLIGETASDGLFPPGWGLFFIAAIKITLGVIVGMVILMLIGMVPPHILTTLIAAIGGIALAVASSRLSLVFPAAAIERPIELRAAWDLAAGNFWRMFACLVLCYLPFAVLHYVLRESGGASAIVWLVFQIIGLAVSFAGVAVVASLLSGLYRQLAGQPAA